VASLGKIVGPCVNNNKNVASFLSLSLVATMEEQGASMGTGSPRPNRETHLGTAGGQSSAGPDWGRVHHLPAAWLAPHPQLCASLKMISPKIDKSHESALVMVND
jgi:hypothetical protein